MDTHFFSIVNVVLMPLLFLGIVLWAYSNKRAKAFTEAARMPLEDDETGHENQGQPEVRP
ncbi:cytochrome c oxidase cbb3-type subunit IV [Gammaproteobacteria bacterium]